MTQKLLISLLLMALTHWSNASNLVFKSRVASVLNTVTLFPDSNYFGNSSIRFSEGELLEIIGETVLEHEDDAQNQKFKWYKVKSLKGQEGWVFGDGIAVLLPQNKLNEKLKSYHRKKIELNDGFEKSVLWLASVEGRDNLHDNDFLNPLYNEFYLVITNERGQSVHINWSGASAMGRKELHHFQLQDLTGDKIPEFIVQTNSYSSSSDLENRLLEIFSIQSGTLTKTLEERMTLTYDDDLISPAMYKFVEVSQQSIRIEFVDYLSCKKYSLPYSVGKKNSTQEKCMEFVTYTYAWDQRKKRFELFYKENRVAVKGVVKSDQIFLKSETSFLSTKIEKLRPNEPFVILKHHEKIFMSNGVKKIVPYLLVQSAAGNQGFIRGKVVHFLNTEHQEVLSDYYKKPPLSKTTLKSDKQFLHIEGEGIEAAVFSEN